MNGFTMQEFIRWKSLEIIGALIVFFTPVLTSALWVGLLVACDLVTGIQKAKRNGTYTTLSKGIRQSLAKFTSYGIGLIVARVLEHVVFKDSFPALQVVMYALIAGEVQSIRENIKEATGNDILKQPAQALSKVIRNKK